MPQAWGQHRLTVTPDINMSSFTVQTWTSLHYKTMGEWSIWQSIRAEIQQQLDVFPAHSQSSPCDPGWLWCPTCTPYDWDTCPASLGCSGSQWGCGAYAHTQLDTHTHRGSYICRCRKRSEEIEREQEAEKRENDSRQKKTNILKEHILPGDMFCTNFINTMFWSFCCRNNTDCFHL